MSNFEIPTQMSNQQRKSEVGILGGCSDNSQPVKTVDYQAYNDANKKIKNTSDNITDYSSEDEESEDNVSVSESLRSNIEQPVKKGSRRKPLSVKYRTPEEIGEVLSFLKFDADKYSNKEWLSIAMILRYEYSDNIETACTLFEEWSARDTRQYTDPNTKALINQYEEGNPSKILRNLTDPDDGKVYTFGTLVYYLKRDAPLLWNRWLDRKFPLPKKQNSDVIKLNNVLNTVTYNELKEIFEFKYGIGNDRGHYWDSTRGRIIEYNIHTRNILQQRTKEQQDNDNKETYYKDGTESMFFPKWFNDKNRRKYDQTTYVPGKEFEYINSQNLKCINLFPEPPMNLIKEYTENLEAIELFKNLILHLCNYEQNVYDYLIKYIAHSVKYPSIKPGVCITLFSDTGGVGKSTLLCILQALFDKSVSMLNLLTDLIDSHSEAMDGGNIWICIDEIGSIKKNSNELDKLKTYITAPTVMIRPLYTNAYKVNSYHRFIFCTNRIINYTVEDDRRHVVINCCETKKPRAYFDEIYKNIIGDQNSLKNIWEWLKTVEVGEYIGELVESTYSKQMNSVNISPIKEWFQEYIQNYALDDCDKDEKIKILNKTLCTSYNNFLQSENSNAYNVDNRAFKKLLLSKTPQIFRTNGYISEAPRSTIGNGFYISVGKLKEYYNVELENNIL